MRARMRIFWWVLTITGLLYATLVGPFAWTHTWWVALLRPAAAGAVFGGVMGLIVRLVRRTAARAFVMVLVVPFQNLALHGARNSLPHGRWLRLVDAPERIVAIGPRNSVRRSGKDTLVLGESGKLWVYACGRDGAACRWEPSARGTCDQLCQSAKRGGCPEAWREPVPAPRPPGRVLDLLDF